MGATEIKEINITESELYSEVDTTKKIINTKKTLTTWQQHP